MEMNKELNFIIKVNISQKNFLKNVELKNIDIY